MHLRCIPRAVRRLSIVLACCLPAAAQSTTTPKLAGIAHIALRVHDLAASRAFYQALGFEEAFDLRRDNVPYQSFIKINDRQFIELYPATEQDPDPGFLHLCFESDDLAGLHDDYNSVGLTPSGLRKSQTGNLLFTMPGPMQPAATGAPDTAQDIEYTQYQSGSLYSEDEGKHLGGDRISDRLLGVWLPMRDPAGALEFYTNSLAFRPLPGLPSYLHLPGVSGQQVVIVSPRVTARPRMLLDTLSLARSLRRLKHENIAFTRLPEGTLLTDPDGNQLLLLQR